MNKTNMPIISVIIAIYNAEEYLNRCFDSILSQTFSDFEVILIDDGSLDKSLEICQSYASKDYRLRVIHKENGGVSSARELGVSLAQGEYCIHVDADDFVENSFLEILYQKAKEKNYDLVICDYFFEVKTNKIIRRNMSVPDSSDFTSSDYMQLIFNGKRTGTLWNKLIRLSLYKKFNVHFPLDIIYCEDVCVLSHILSNDIKLASVDKALYYHCFNKESITRKLTKEIFGIRQKYINYITSNFKDKYNLDYHILSLKLGMIKSGLFSINEYKEIFPLVKQNKRTNLGFKNKLYLNLARFRFSYFLQRIFFKYKNKSK